MGSFDFADGDSVVGGFLAYLIIGLLAYINFLM